MQGTVVMLIALSGLGCHHKSNYVAYGPPSYSCFGGGCYANVYPSDYVSPSCYSGCFSSNYSGCYGACYGGCYGVGYSGYAGGYGGHHGCGLFSKIFGCCGHGSSYGYDDTYAGPGGYDLPYDPPIFGYALQYNYGGMGSEQYPSSNMSPMPVPTPVPSEAAPPVAPNPVPSTPKPPAPTPEMSVPATPPPPPAADVPSPKPPV
jgi:hypothetical protein